MDKTLAILLMVAAACAQAYPTLPAVATSAVSGNGLDMGCNCVALACGCGVKGQLALPNGDTVEFTPSIVIEMKDDNMTIAASVRNGDNVLVSREVSGKQLPEICVPIEKFPVIMVCFLFHDIALRNGNALQVCADIEVRSIVGPMTLARWPTGCFEGGPKGLQWNGFQHPQLIFPPEMSGKPGIPGVPQPVFDAIAQYLPPFPGAQPATNATPFSMPKLTLPPMPSLPSRTGGASVSSGWPSFSMPSLPSFTGGFSGSVGWPSLTMPSPSPPAPSPPAANTGSVGWPSFSMPKFFF